MLERWHRTLKAALMCNPHIPWPKLLPTVLLGLRTAYKEDLKASSSELLLGTTLRLPGDFFTTNDASADPRSFVEQLRSHFRALKPLPTNHDVTTKHFVHKDLATSTHVFRRNDAVKSPLTPPYAGPYRVLKRLDQKHFVIDVNGEPKTINIDSLHPAFIANEDIESTQPPSASQRPAQPSVSFQIHQHSAATPASQQPGIQQPSASPCPPSQSDTRGE